MLLRKPAVIHGIGWISPTHLRIGASVSTEKLDASEGSRNDFAVS